MTSRKRGRVGWAVFMAGVLGALLLFLAWPSSPPPAALEPRRSEAPSASPGPAVVEVQASQAKAPASEPQPPPPGTTLERPPEPPKIMLPPTTQPLAEEFFPGTTEWEDVPVDEGRRLVLRVLPARYNVVVPMPIVVRLEALDRTGQRQPLANPRVRLRALENEGMAWIELPVRDDGGDGDAVANDRQYTATLRPNDAQKKALLGRVLVEGSADFPGVGTRTVPTALIYTLGPRARLSGRWHDELKEGHLLLTAEVEVEEAGLFTLMAQIFGPQLEPIAWVKQTQRLEKGGGSLPLQVFGKVLHDAGIDGPYRVRQVLLTRDREGSADYDPGVTVEEAHQTKAYRAQEFSAAEWEEPPRVLKEEITADHPSQQGKPGPERTRTLSRP